MIVIYRQYGYRYQGYRFGKILVSVVLVKSGIGTALGVREYGEGKGEGQSMQVSEALGNGVPVGSMGEQCRVPLLNLTP